ncbi:MAG: hypothetical protein IT442_14930 [Phycisphaeraceae bacterium]|nr:hypothetical protein [Phycisphaeraceae bacterium]
MSVTKRWMGAADVAVTDVGELLVRSGGAVEIKRAKINATSNGAAGNTLLPGVAGKKLCVLGVCLIAAGAVNATFYSGPADTGTAVSAALALAANGGFILPVPGDREQYWFATNAGEALTLLLSAAVQCSGWIIYFEV